MEMQPTITKNWLSACHIFGNCSLSDMMSRCDRTIQYKQERIIYDNGTNYQADD